MRAPAWPTRYATSFAVNGTEVMPHKEFSFGLVLDAGFGILRYNGFVNNPNADAQDRVTQNRIARQASRLEVRFYTVYQPGCLDLQAFTQHGWKTSARVEDVRVQYEGQSRILDEQVTAR